MRVRDEVTFNIFKTMKFPFEVHSYFQISDMDLVVAETFRARLLKLPLEVSLSTTLKYENEEVRECVKYLEVETSFHLFIKQKFKELDSFMQTSLSKELPKLELKPLLSNLRYVFLGQDFIFLIIINSYLSDVKEEILLRVLREHNWDG